MASPRTPNLADVLVAQGNPEAARIHTVASIQERIGESLWWVALRPDRTRLG